MSELLLIITYLLAFRVFCLFSLLFVVKACMHATLKSGTKKLASCELYCIESVMYLSHTRSLEGLGVK